MTPKEIFAFVMIVAIIPLIIIVSSIDTKTSSVTNNDPVIKKTYVDNDDDGSDTVEDYFMYKAVESTFGF